MVWYLFTIFAQKNIGITLGLKFKMHFFLSEKLDPVKVIIVACKYRMFKWTLLYVYDWILDHFYSGIYDKVKVFYRIYLTKISIPHTCMYIHNTILIVYFVHCVWVWYLGGSTSIRKDTQSSVNENELLYRAIV